MGCLNSTPSSSENDSHDTITKSESIEITDTPRTNNEKKTSDSVSQENEKNNYHVQNETKNILQRKDSEPPAIPPAESSPKHSKKQRDSLESSGEKKLKLSELLHAEKMKKTSGNVPLPASSGEVVSVCESSCNLTPYLSL
jgi:hypothetical protein